VIDEREPINKVEVKNNIPLQNDKHVSVGGDLNGGISSGIFAVGRGAFGNGTCGR